MNAESATENSKSNLLIWKPLSLLILLSLALLCTFYYQTVSSIVAIWMRSETFAHGFLIIPIVVWLVYEKRKSLIRKNPAAAYLTLLLSLPVGFIWLLGYLVDALVVQQFAFVGMVIIVLWGILGNKVTAYLMFPLGFLFFAVPVGEGLVPGMMNFTADFTVGMLKLTGLPVFRDGNFFSIPSGNWSVVEACSGVRYLIASVTLGALYSYLTYHKWWKRVIFILVSIIVPIIANGIRAYLIVMIGHLSDMTLAVGVDHLVYGWLFFGIVVTIMFVIGSVWRDPIEPEAAPDAKANGDNNVYSVPKAIIAAVAGLCAAAIWPVVAHVMDRNEMTIAQTPAMSTPAAVDGWRLLDQPAWDWKPHITSSDADLYRFYEKDGKVVAVYLAYYEKQRQGSELISSSNAMVLTIDPIWRRGNTSSINTQLNENSVQVIQTKISSIDKKLVSWHWYRISGYYTSNAYKSKLIEAFSRIFGQRRDSIYMVVATSFNYKTVEAKPVLNSFLNSMLGQIEISMNKAAGIEEKQHDL